MRDTVWKGFGDFVEIIEGKQAVVLQVQTRSASQGKVTQAQYHGVQKPDYQALIFHGVRQEQGERQCRDARVDNAPVNRIGMELAEDTQAAAEIPAAVTSPRLAKRQLKPLQREMTLEELFLRAEDREEG